MTEVIVRFVLALALPTLAVYAVVRFVKWLEPKPDARITQRASKAELETCAKIASRAVRRDA